MDRTFDGLAAGYVFLLDSISMSTSSFGGAVFSRMLGGLVAANAVSFCVLRLRTGRAPPSHSGNSSQDASRPERRRRILSRVRAFFRLFAPHDRMTRRLVTPPMTLSRSSLPCQDNGELPEVQSMSCTDTTGLGQRMRMMRRDGLKLELACEAALASRVSKPY